MSDQVNSSTRIQFRAGPIAGELSARVIREPSHNATVARRTSVATTPPFW
jgi:hypothetical protein